MVFDGNSLENLARNTGFVNRLREFVPLDFLVSMITQFSCGNPPDLAGLHRAYFKDYGSMSSYGAWYEKLNRPEFVTFTRECFQRFNQNLHTDLFAHQEKLLDKFKDIFMQDGSSYGINPHLVNVFPGRFTTKSPAAVELHAFFSLRLGHFVNLQIAPDKESEYLFMPESNPLLKDTLSLFDRGYCSLKRLHKLEVSGGKFITRWKASANPIVTGAVIHQRRDRRMVGKKFKDCVLKAGKNYDLEVQFGKKPLKFECLRLVAIWNPKTKKHVLFVTNVSAELLNLKEIGQIYRIRWQIELIFKDLKSHSGLRKFLTSNEHIVEGLIWLSLISFLVRRYFVVIGQLWLKKQLSFLKAGRSAPSFMPELMEKIRCSTKKLQEHLLSLFAFFDDMCAMSNPKRGNALESIGLGLNR